MSLEALKRNGHNLELGSFELSGEYGIPALRPVQLDSRLTWIRFNHALREPKIYVNKGVSGMYVDAISANSGEYEFLFNRDTRFKVHGIKTNASGRITELVLEAVPTKKKR